MLATLVAVPDLHRVSADLQTRVILVRGPHLALPGATLYTRSNCKFSEGVLMFKYEEMCEAAETARKKWIEYREHCWRDMGALVHGLATYCAIPIDRITFLRWNKAKGEAGKYTEAEEGMKYTLTGAMEYDDTDRFWRLGVCITLSPPGVIPEHYVSFALCLSQHDGKAIVKVGDIGKPYEIEFDRLAQCNDFYDGIVESVKQSFSDPQKPGPKTIGFKVS